MTGKMSKVGNFNSFRTDFETIFRVLFGNRVFRFAGFAHFFVPVSGVLL